MQPNEILAFKVLWNAEKKLLALFIGLQVLVFERKQG